MTGRPIPGSEVAGTVAGVLSDLEQIAERLPVPAGEAEAAARLLDRLSEETAEAAAMLRQAGGG